jgi:hypothetical protein
MTEARRFWWVILALWVLTVLGHLAGALLFPDQLWGSHLYRFVGPAVAIPGILLAVLAGALLFVTPAHLPSPPTPHRRTWMLEIATAGAAFVLFWTFRVRHLLLGDSYVVVNTLPQGGGLHPREPLTQFLHESVYRALQHLPAMHALPPSEVAWRGVALESAICGALLVLVASRLAREIARAGIDRAPAGLIALVLMTQGYTLLCFGYVENYTYPLLAIALYLFVALRHLNGRGSLLAPAATMILACGLHLSAVSLVPSLAVLAIRGLSASATRRRTLRDLIAAAVLLIALLLMPSLLGSRLSGGEMVRNILVEAWHGHRTGSGISYIFSGRHVRDFFNEQFLIGPLGMFLLLPAGVMAIASGVWRRATPLFLLTAAVVPLAGSWMASDPALGYPRDWDVFAPFALVFTTAGLGLFLIRGWGESDSGDTGRTGASDRIGSKDPDIRGFLLCAAVLSLFHLLPWVAVNASEARALERTKHLPMGYGRGQVVVGRYYLERKLYPDAKRWFEESLREYPRNVNAYQLLGSMYVEQGEWEKAAEAYERAIVLRPDKLEFHDECARTLVQLGRYREAEKHLRFVAVQLRHDPNAWRALGMVLQKLGQADSAQAAFDRADRETAGH